MPERAGNDGRLAAAPTDHVATFRRLRNLMQDGEGGVDEAFRLLGRLLAEAGPYSIGSSHWPGISKLMEEMGELGQVLGKLLGTNGQPDHWDGSDLRLRLIEEMGDVLGALDFTAQMNLTPHERVEMSARAEAKRRLFFEWQDAQSQTVDDGEPDDMTSSSIGPLSAP